MPNRSEKKMFALAMPGRPGGFDFDDKAARFYRDCGYTGVYFENDYDRFGTPATWGCWVDVNEVLSLWRFSMDEAADRYVGWLKHQSEIARCHGLKVYLKVWDPRVPCSVRDRIPLEARGANRNGFPPNACLSSPEGNRLIREFHREALERLDMIDGLIIGLTDNFADVCDDSCPRCAGKSLNDQFTDYFRLLLDVVGDVRPELDVILYDWGAVNDYFIPNEFIDRMMEVSDEGVRAITRFTQFARQQIPGYSGPAKGIMDITLAVDGPGPVVENYLPKMKSGKLRLLDMIPTGNSEEFFGHPYAPAPGVYFKRWRSLRECGFDGFVDYDCGGVTPGIIAETLSRLLRTEPAPDDVDGFLRKLARETYGEKAVETVVDAWWRCEEVLRAYPIDLAPSAVWAYSARVGISMVYTIGLVPRLELFTGEDYKCDPYFGYPYSMLVPEIIDVQERQFGLVAEKMTQSADGLRRAVDLAAPDRRSFARTEADLAEALALAYASQHNWSVMAQSVYRGLPGRTPADAEWVRKAFERERKSTIRYAELHQKNRLIYSNPTWDIIGLTRRLDPSREIDPERPFDDKIAILRELLSQA